MSKNTPEVDQAIADAQNGFNLDSILLNEEYQIDDKITLFVDKPTGRLLGAPGIDEQAGFAGVVLQQAVPGTGVLGKLHEIGEVPDDAPDDVKEALALLRRPLEEERDQLIEKLKESALTLTLKSIPDVAREAAVRETRKVTGFKGKVPADDVDRFNLEGEAQVLSLVVTEIFNHKTGKNIEPIGVETMRSLKRGLPPTQYVRLQEKLGEIQYRSAISTTITASADF